MGVIEDKGTQYENEEGIQQKFTKRTVRGILLIIGVWVGAYQLILPLLK